MLLLPQVAFVLPTSLPVTSETLNYAGVAVGIVLLGACAVWVLPRIGARHWYRGELKNYRELEVSAACCRTPLHAPPAGGLYLLPHHLCP